MPYKINIHTWVGFYGISTMVGYLMPNPAYAYVHINMICKHFVDNIFK